ncbi:hypothetical protein ACFWY9_30045 [Amycolatopsis sp. NPDC059027]|uniref:hypothetical protein n=1 Tax=unclassified Amycolatopsis TaxID=2618356 RepID=UPI00366CD4C3
MEKIIRQAALVTAVLACASTLAVPQATAAPAGQSACSGTAVAPAFSDWVRAKGSAGIAGHPGYRQGYDLMLQSNAGVALAEVKGYDERNGNKEIWVGVPAMSPDSPHRLVAIAWGNNLAMPEIRVKPATGQLAGVTVTFKC